KLPQGDIADAVIVALAQNGLRALARRQDVLAQIGKVDRSPDRIGRAHGFLVAQMRVTMKIGFRVLERRAAQAQETLDVPAADRFLVGIEIDREIEKIRNERLRLLAL